MKKFPLVLTVNFLVASLGSLTACSTNQKIDLMYGDTSVKDVTTLKFDQLKEKIDSKDNFLLAVQYSEGCGCWSQDAHPVFERFIEEKHVNIYHIKLEELDGGGNRFGITIITGNVSFAVFEDGEVKSCVTTKDDTTLKKYDDFTAYLDSLVALPRIYYSTLDDIDKIYKTEEKNIVYFGRKTCGDCAYLETHYLKTWSKNNPGFTKKIYLLDCDQQDIRLDDEGKVNAEQWQQFKDDYGLSTKRNPTYGYDTGYVPTMLLVKGSLNGPEFLSGTVVFNDSVSKVDDKFVVSNSYFTEERLPNLAYIDDKVEHKVIKGLELTLDDVTYNEEKGWARWNHESAEKYHNIMVEKFLAWSEKQ